MEDAWNWLIQVCVRFRLFPEMLYLTVNIIDRFLATRVVSFAKLQLVGITCMFLAAKVEEIVALLVVKFFYCADSSYTEGKILQAEKSIPKTLEWNMGYPNPVHFLLRRVSKADKYNVQVCRMETHRCPTIVIGCGIDVVGSLRAQDRGKFFDDMFSDKAIHIKTNWGQTVYARR